jgi:hypothetical protein
MRQAYWITLLATVVLSSFAGATQNDGKVWWPQFRGRNSSGLSEGNPPVNFDPNQNILWKTAVGPRLSSPIIWEGRIFLTEFDRAKKQLSTLCIDRRTGEILWRRTVAPEHIEEVHEINSPAGATPPSDSIRVSVELIKWAKFRLSLIFKLGKTYSTRQLYPSDSHSRQRYASISSAFIQARPCNPSI